MAVRDELGKASNLGGVALTPLGSLPGPDFFFAVLRRAVPRNGRRQFLATLARTP